MAHVERACEGDAELLAELRSLLAADEKVSPLLDRTAPGDGADVPPPEHPEAIGPYRILGVLGEGGMGVVYRAEQTEPLRREVALKVVRLGMDSRKVLARFEAERQALAMMDHPGVARVYDAGVGENGRPFFAMELVVGEPITDYCDRRDLNIDARLELFAGVCNAVQHAHQKGVIHRDLKPGNVLVTEVDDRPVPKVIDFGIAKAVSGKLADVTLETQHGLMIGTPGYMSPEQTKVGEEDVDTRTDVYSLGVILYELLSGRLPFEDAELRAAGLEGIHRLIRETTPPKPSRRVPTSTATARRLRGDLDWIVMRCLEKERDRRYPTASDLAQDVRRYLENEPVDAGPPTATYRVGKFVRRHRAGVLATVAAAALVIGSTIALAVLLDQARDARAEAERERKVAEAAVVEANRQIALADAVNDYLTNDLLGREGTDALGRDATVRQVLDRASETIAGRFADDPKVEAGVRRAIGNTYVALGQYGAAQRHFEAAVDLVSATEPPDSPDVLLARFDDAWPRMHTGEMAEAEERLLELQEPFARVFGPQHRQTIRIKYHLAGVAAAKNDNEQHARLLAEVLAAQQATLGADAEETLRTRSELAGAYGVLGRLDPARREGEAAHGGMRERLGGEHPRTLAAAYALAGTYEKLGRLEQAETFFLETLVTQRRALGMANPDTRRTARKLGGFYVRRGRPTDALPLLEEVAAAEAETLPADHPLRGATLSTYGLCLLRLDRLADAEAALTEARDILLPTLGPTNPFALQATQALAEVATRRNAKAASGSQ